MPVTSGSRAIVWTVIVIAVVVNAAGYALNWYQEFWWFDKVLHAYTTFAVTLPLALLLYGAVLAVLRGHRFVLVLTIVNLGVALGALWEIAEFGVAGFGDPDIETKMDTVMDLIMDLAGAFVAALVSVRMMERAALPMSGHDRKASRKQAAQKFRGNV
jgi:VanZ family protein